MTFDQIMQLTQTVSGAAAFQDDEARAYFDLLNALPDGAIVLEVGLQFGRSSSIVAQLTQEKHFQYFGIDPFTDPPDAGPAWLSLMQRIGAPFTLFKMKSTEVQLKPSPLDLVLIDGDHNEDGVRIDCQKWLPLVRSGGHALFHDYGRESLPNVYPTARQEMIQQILIGESWEELPTVGTLGIWQRT